MQNVAWPKTIVQKLKGISTRLKAERSEIPVMIPGKAIGRITRSDTVSRPKKRERATAEAISLGVDPRLVLSEQFMQNSNYNRHARTLPELEKRVRLLSAEYRELQKARPIDVVPVAQS